MRRSTVLQVLAASILAGEPTTEQIDSRLRLTLGREWRWLHALADRYTTKFADQARPRRRDGVQFLRNDTGFQRAWRQHHRELKTARWLAEPQRMQPVAAAARWDLPSIESAGALAAWFGLSPGELFWFADLKGLGSKKSEARLRHYHYRVLAKPYGNIRLIEAPKLLKELQRQVLSRVLEKIPSHPAVHGFVKGRSIKTFAAPHAGQRVVLRMDLQDFFPSFGAARIQALFRTLGYPESVADLLAGICTSAVPADAWATPVLEVDPHRWREASKLYAKPHLPQGAPTSPALANLCSYRMDCRLAGLAKSAGAEYTRYADDLAFSGDEAFERHVDRFSAHVGAVLIEEGFTVNFRKTRVMRQGVRQHLAGLVTNRHVNVMRPDFDRLKATLTNCVRLGPASQNREGNPSFRAHLEGRVAFVESVNSGKGQRLRRIFDQISWP